MTNSIMVDEVIFHLKQNIFTELKSSDIHGIGVFSIMEIPKDTYVFPKWPYESGIYHIPKNRLSEIPEPVLKLINMNFINDDPDYKIIKLFQGFNYLFHSSSFCNSSYPHKEKQNVDGFGKALRDIHEGEEILEWYLVD